MACPGDIVSERRSSMKLPTREERQGWKIPEIRAHVVGSYYLMDFALDETR